MAGEDKAYLQFVRLQRCRLWMHDPCLGATEAHHAGTRKGMGMRDHDDTAIPLCRKHHRAWHDVQAPFRGMSKDDRRAWAIRQINWTREEWKGWQNNELF